MSTKSSKARTRTGDIIVYLITGIFTLLTIIPVWWIVNKSLSKTSTLTSTNLNLLPEGGVTLGNFAKVFQDKDFTLWFKNSMIFSVSTTLIVIVFATMAAYAFARFSFPGKNGILTGFLIYMMLPTTVAMIAQYYIWNKLGLLNSYPGMIIIYIAGNMTFTIWLLKGYFDTIPKSLEEAAIIDGASKLAVFTKIILPLSTPAIAVCALFAFIAPWTDYITAWIFISDPSKYTLAMGLYGWVSDPRNIPWNLFAAGSLIVALPIAILYFVFQNYIVSGLTAGGVKG